MPTYEMLWDCSSCGTPKLLGKTHRRCPQCGAPQDPTKRYFPPAGQEVPVEGHVYVGVDWRCAGCETPNSRAALCCVNCGNPRDGNAAVKLVEDAPALPRPPVRGALRAPGRRGLWVAAGLVGAALLAFVLVAIFWTKSADVTVTGHTWKREIDVEEMASRRQSDWCSSMPGDAYSVSRSREVRSHREIPDGQTCRTVRKDNGDGTYSTSEECKTKYRSEPVYDDKCHYSVNRWGVARTERAQGAGVSPAPAWPGVRIVRPGTCLGCEREGARRETLTVALRERSGAKTWSCDIDNARWSALSDGAAATVDVRVVTGGAVCGSLR